jgi:hypothetical protein
MRLDLSDICRSRQRKPPPMAMETWGFSHEGREVWNSSDSTQVLQASQLSAPWKKANPERAWLRSAYTAQSPIFSDLATD